MRGLIDIHSHCIPFVDDGSDSMEKSIKMLKNAQRMGVSKVICTPHYSRTRGFLTEGSTVKKNFDLLIKEKEKDNIPIDLYLGNEIYLSSLDEFKKIFYDKGLFTMNGTKYVLIEFSFDEEIDVLEVLHRIKMEGYKAVIAHIERYNYLTLDDIIEIKEFGALIQVNASSLLGYEGHKIMKKSMSLIKMGIPDFVSSDVHYDRENHLDKAYKLLEKKCDKEYLEYLFSLSAKKYFNIE